MADFAEYENYDGLGLAALIHDGKVSRREVLDSALDRLDRVNPHLNAIVHRTDPEAAAARGQEGPFAGVPFLIKDLYCFEKGVPCGNGSHLFDGYVADFDSELVVRQRRAGPRLRRPHHHVGDGPQRQHGDGGLRRDPAIPGTWSAPPAAPAAARRPRWRRASCPWRMPPTGAGRSVSPPPPAVCSA